MSYCDCEMPEFYSNYSPTARKEHKCCECRGVIQAGEKYDYFSGKWDGEMSVFKTCSDCKLLRGAVLDLQDACDCIAFGSLYEEIFEDDNLQLMKEFIAVKEKRGAKIHDWMIEAVNQLEPAAQSEKKDSL